MTPLVDSTAVADAATVAADSAAAAGLEFNAVGAACVRKNVQANVSHATDTDRNGGLATDSACKFENENISSIMNYFLRT